jgi:hypothetical protein
VDPRAGLDNVEKRIFLILPGLELRSLGRPARSQSLYRLSYLGFSNICENLQITNFQVSHFLLSASLNNADTSKKDLVGTGVPESQ